GRLMQRMEDPTPARTVPLATAAPARCGLTAALLRDGRALAAGTDRQRWPTAGNVGSPADTTSVAGETESLGRRRGISPAGPLGHTSRRARGRPWPATTPTPPSPPPSP